MLYRQSSRLALLAAGVALLLASQPAPAQYYPVGDRRPEMSTGRTYFESHGAGYSLYIPAATYAGRYDFYPGKYTGVYAPTRFASSTGYYATMPSGYSPIMMTSLNYPGIYGAYVLGPGAAGNNLVPAFQTIPDNRPSDNPVGAPYAPLARSLMDVPLKPRIEVSTQPELRTARSAMIDVFLPPQAALTFQGQPTTEEGGVRVFQSPALEPGRTYTYDIRATWRTDDGREVSRTRRLSVSAGDHLTVDFNRGATAPAEELQRPTLRTQPQPLLRDVRPEPNR
jgi:uncharacterized protein (TIGR03000 family)